MTKSLSRPFRGKNAVTFALAIGALMLVALGCGSNTPAPPAYVGVWSSGDGTTITIRSDGSADYKSSNSSVSGGGAVIDEAAKTLKISLAGLGPTFKIDKAPDGNQMTLDGIVFKKTGGGSTSSSNTKPEVPSNDKLQTLVKTSFLDFGDAVQSGDFADFHKKVAKVWRDSSSVDEFNKNFKGFIDNKEVFDFKKLISSLDATFEPPPAIETIAGLDALRVRGYYQTNTNKKRIRFDLKYAKEDDIWKLIGVNIMTGED